MNYKKILSLSLFLVLSVFSFAKDGEKELVIYGPSSSKWIGKHYAPIFKEKTGVDLKYISISGFVPRLELEKSNPKADIIVGLTSLQTAMAKERNLILPYIPKNIGNIKNEDYVIDKEGYSVPFDYGLLAINYNKQKIKTAPKNLEELSKLEKQLLVENPNTSNTGEEILLWSIALYGNNFKKFWTDLKPAIYNVEPGWNEAFQKFTIDEAPMMLGYATSNVFFVQDEAQKDKFDTFLLEDGNFMYLEGVSLINKKDVKDSAKQFLEMVLEKEFQELVPKKNYMFPVTDVALGEEFNAVPTEGKKVTLTDEQIKDLIKNLDVYKAEVMDILKN